MWRNRRVTELFGIEHPILLAPMAGAIDFEIAAEVAEAGGLGSLPCAMLTPEKLREQFEKFKSRTRKPLNVNFLLPRRTDAEQCARACLARAAADLLPGARHRSGRADPIEQPRAVRSCLL